MKKILVVLLVLAVATGVFAQEGEWSFNGKVEMGAVVNFDPEPGTEALATSSFTQYNRLYDDWDGLKGQFGINYNRDGFTAGLTLTDQHPTARAGVDGRLTYGGENFNFAAESSLEGLLGNRTDVIQLWGNYSFLNGLFFLEAAYMNQGPEFWVSDTNGAFRNWNGRGNDMLPGVFGKGNTFTKVDGDWDQGPSSYIVGDIRLQGLSFGLMIRDLFLGDTDQGEWYESSWNTGGYYGNSVNNNLFVDGVLRKMIFGVKFEMAPIEVAAQFLMEDFGVYFGGKWFVGPVTVGLSFMGIMAPRSPNDSLTQTTGTAYDYITKVGYDSTNDTLMRVGGGVEYNAETFGASIGASFTMWGDKSENDRVSVNAGLGGSDTNAGKKTNLWGNNGYNATFGYISKFGVEPGFFYNVIPTHLQFKLDAGFYFFSYINRNEKETDGVNAVQYALQPQIFWNFMGTGAGGYWGHGTGIVLRYRMVGGDPEKVAPMGLNNKFDVNFKWSF